MTKIVYPLHKGRSKRTILEIIPDDDGLYRIAWPDIGLSDRANLTRCKQAALEWAHNQSSPRTLGQNLTPAKSTPRGYHLLSSRPIVVASTAYERATSACVSPLLMRAIASCCW